MVISGDNLFPKASAWEGWKSVKRFDLSRLNAIIVPLLAGALGLIVGAVMLLALGANPLDAYAAMAQGAFGSPNAFADTLVKASPLLFVGIGTCIAYRCGVINIGGEFLLSLVFCFARQDVLE